MRVFFRTHFQSHRIYRSPRNTLLFPPTGGILYSERRIRIKSQSIILAVCCTVAASAAWADDAKPVKTSSPEKATTEKVTASDKAKAKTQNSAIKTETGVITGSYIPRTIRRNERVAYTTTQPLTILDRSAIEQSGGADVRQVLALTGTASTRR